MRVCNAMQYSRKGIPTSFQCISSGSFQSRSLLQAKGFPGSRGKFACELIRRAQQEQKESLAVRLQAWLAQHEQD
jgi:hypothetical protein